VGLALFEIRDQCSARRAGSFPNRLWACRAFALRGWLGRRGTDGSQTLCWRKRDSNPRSPRGRILKPTPFSKSRAKDGYEMHLPAHERCCPFCPASPFWRIWRCRAIMVSVRADTKARRFRLLSDDESRPLFMRQRLYHLTSAALLSINGLARKRREAGQRWRTLGRYSLSDNQ
jgi:hypothetical protein